MKQPADLSMASKLRLARAYMAEHGFTAALRVNGRCCFIAAISDANTPSSWKLGEYDRITDFIRPHIRAERAFIHTRFIPLGHEFGIGELSGFTTDRALKVFDAAVAEAEAKGL